MKNTYPAWAALGASLLLAACGGGGGADSAGTTNTAPGRGQLVQSPAIRSLSLSAAELTGELSAAGPTGQLLLQLATGSTSGTLSCGIDVYYVKYGTVGGKGEATQASAAVMVPTGSSTNCSGPRPIVLHAHGTAVERRFNMADFADTTNPAHGEQSVVASQLAAKGYIVVAPNYAGYDSSTLPYHPFLVADQQSKDMIDALTAARTALQGVAGVSDNGKLFLSGVSQGGHVAMATFKAMRALGMNVTALAPSEPVSSLLNYGDYILSGHVPLGSTGLIPMLLTGYQKTYGNVYNSPTDYYTSTYAAGIESAFPGKYSSDALLSNKIIPQTALFSSGAATTPAALAPIFAAGVGAGNLITDTGRASYLADAGNPATASAPVHPLRAALKANDMLSLSVDRPTLICGGSSDPTVFYSVNSEASAIAMAGNPYVTLLDMENAYPLTSTISAVTKASTSDPATAALLAGFAHTKALTQAADPTNPLATVVPYHGQLVPPFCVAAASGFFSHF